MKPNVVLFACAGVVWAVAAVACAATSHRASDVLVGVGYFAGWWQGSGDKWFEPWNATVDWRPLYPGRVPLLGDYNTQRAMDAEIQAAAAHGVDFWQILYYDPYPAPREPNAQFLNRGISNFMARWVSSERHATRRRTTHLTVDALRLCSQPQRTSHAFVGSAVLHLLATAACSLTSR